MDMMLQAFRSHIWLDITSPTIPRPEILVRIHRVCVGNILHVCYSNLSQKVMHHLKRHTAKK